MGHYTKGNSNSLALDSADLIEMSQSFLASASSTSKAHSWAKRFTHPQQLMAFAAYPLIHAFCFIVLYVVCKCFMPVLDETRKRVAAGALACRFQGILSCEEIAVLMQLSSKTVIRGRDEYQQQNFLHIKDKTKAGCHRIRRVGGGRKGFGTEYDAIIKQLIESQQCYGDPQNAGCQHCPYYNKSTLLAAIRQETGNNHLSKQWLSQSLRRLGYTLKRNKKLEQVGDPHVDRNAQFESKILPLKQAYQCAKATFKQYGVTGSSPMLPTALFNQMRALNPVRFGLARVREGLDPCLSCDSKKKELIGNFAQSGCSFNTVITKDHDFGHSITTPEGTEIIEKATPVGVLDCGLNSAVIGLTHRDNPEFVVKNLRYWYKQIGRFAYPFAQNIYIQLDCGGSNAARSRAFKKHIALFAEEIGVNVVICHFPQGCSKYNPIEHVVFSQVSLQMRAHPLISFDVFAELINATKTKTGLYVQAYVAERSVEDWCEKTKPVSASEMASINIEFYPPYQAQKPEESKKWNYVISPTSRRRTVHFEHYGQYAKCCSKFLDS